MAILIKDHETDQMIRMLVERTGESITDAVKEAVRERLKRVPLSEEEIALRKARLDRLVAEAKKFPTVDDRSADEIVGYNASGHFD